MTNDELANRAIEQKVLSYLLEYEEEQAEYWPKLHRSDFYHFQDTYDLYSRLSESKDEDLDSATVFNRGDENRINDIMRTSVSPGEIDSLISNLKDLSTRRKLYTFTKQIEGAVQSDTSIKEKIVELEDQFVDLTQDLYSSDSLKPVNSLIDSVKDHLDELRATDHLSGVPTGMDGLNNLLAGYQDGEYILIAARTSVGKTDFMLNSALTAGKNQRNVGIFSLEMSSENLIKRLVSQISGIDRQKIRRGIYNDKEERRIKKSLKSLGKLPIFIDDQSNQIDEISYKIQRQVKQNKLDVVFIDYFGLINMPKVQNGTVQNEKAQCSHKLKFLAKEVDIPIVVLAQLNRGAEYSDNPKISHLRGTGALEQDADTTLILDRPGLHEEDERADRAKINIGKQRNGPTDTLENIKYNPKTGAFTDDNVD